MRHAYNLWHASLLATPLCSFFIFDRFVFFLFISEGESSFEIGRMKAPKCFWKAVCAKGQSIVFVAENNVGEDLDTKVNYGTCLKKEMRMDRGIIRCYSLKYAKSLKKFTGFKFPDFTPAKCSITKKGKFLDTYLTFN